MPRNRAIEPTNSEIAWALSEAMTNTLTPIHSVWHGFGHHSFWNEASVSVNELYDFHINHFRTVAPITPRGLWRLTRKNWKEITDEIRTEFQDDENLTEMLLDFDVIEEMKRRGHKSAA